MTSKCSTTKYLFRTTSGKVVACDDEYDACIVYKMISTERKVVVVACQPTHNLNAVVTFDYHYSGTIPTTPTPPAAGVNNFAKYSSCIEAAYNASSMSQVSQCGRSPDAGDLRARVED